MRRLIKKTVVAFAVLLVAALGIPAAALADSVLGVEEAPGKKGETVEVVVSIQGIAALGGVEGISGGELVIVYDPALAEVKKANSGGAISGFMFIPNLRLTENSIKVVWASGNRLTSADGEICRVLFTMKQDGILQPALKDLLIFDQDVRPLHVAAIDPAPGEGEVPSGSDSDQDDGGAAGDSESSDKEPAGGRGAQGSGDKVTSAEGAARYSLSPPDGAAPVSPGADAGGLGGAGDTGETGDEEVRPHQGSGTAAPGAPAEKKPGLGSTQLFLIILAAAVLFGLAGFVVYRKYGQKARP